MERQRPDQRNIRGRQELVQEDFEKYASIRDWDGNLSSVDKLSSGKQEIDEQLIQREVERSYVDFEGSGSEREALATVGNGALADEVRPNVRNEFEEGLSGQSYPPGAQRRSRPFSGQRELRNEGFGDGSSSAPITPNDGLPSAIDNRKPQF